MMQTLSRRVIYGFLIFVSFVACPIFGLRALGSDDGAVGRGFRHVTGSRVAVDEVHGHGPSSSTGADTGPTRSSTPSIAISTSTRTITPAQPGSDSSRS